MKTKEVQVAENFSDAMQLAKESGLGIPGLIVALILGVVIGTTFYTASLVYRLFEIRYRKKNHHLPIEKRVYLLMYYRHTPTNLLSLVRMKKEPYVRTRMGR